MDLETKAGALRSRQDNAAELFSAGYTVREVAKALGISDRTALRYRSKWSQPPPEPPPPSLDFEVEDLPTDDTPIEEIIERRCREAERQERFYSARELINVKINLDGPIGICHWGDPHLDSKGTDFRAIKRAAELCRDTEGLYAGNTGDLQDNWVGRLSGLYAYSSTSAKEAWQLIEWLFQTVPFLYLVRGNHDDWSGKGDPLDWIKRGLPGVTEKWLARINLQFPNGRDIRVSCRHDWSGHSMWNPAHGPGRAVQMGWRDHIVLCGHKHMSGYMVLKDPKTGLISHALRVAGFKRWDYHSTKSGFDDHNISPTVTTIIDPMKEDNDPDLITVIFGLERAAEYLTWLRSRCGA